MINAVDNPVPWALLLDELGEAKEHLQQLIFKITTDRMYDESRFRADMGHVMAHLNRAWARRNCVCDLTDEEWESFRQYPQDLPPVA